MALLDFLVIGAQKSGTTTLWDLLRDHPQLELPPAKEVPFFADDRLYALGLDDYVARYFSARKNGALRGSVSPQYMFDSATLDVAGIAARIAGELPAVKLIALLRDPVERAISHHRMSVRRGRERRPVARALRDQLAPGVLAAARIPVAETTAHGEQARVYANSRYVVAGEYGRILAAYRRVFPSSQLLVLLTSELDADPENVLERVLRFLGVDHTWRPPDLSVRRMSGGDQVRVAPADLQLLLDLLAGAVPEAPIGAFDVALEEWNTLRGTGDSRLPDELESALRAHYAADARLLQEICAIRVSWVALDGSAPAPARSASQRTATPTDGPMEIMPERMSGVDEVIAEIAGAADGGRGFSLVRLSTAEALLLGHGLWPVRKPNLAALGIAEHPDEAAETLREAIRNADAVGVATDRSVFEAAPLLEAEMNRFDLRPRLLCAHEIDYDLVGVGRATGVSDPRSPLLEVLRNRPIAVVCPAALLDGLTPVGLTVGISVALDDISEVERAVQALAAGREAYDVVIAVAGVPGKVVCSRAGRELEVVALDIGRPLYRYLHPRAGLPEAPLRARIRWELAEYLRSLDDPVPAWAGPLEGRLVRDPDGRVFYVERGRARIIGHTALLRLFDHPPQDVEREVIDTLPRGAPLAVVHERLSGPYVLLDGRKLPVNLGVPVIDLEDHALREVADDPRPLRWDPDV